MLDLYGFGQHRIYVKLTLLINASLVAMNLKVNMF